MILLLLFSVDARADLPKNRLQLQEIQQRIENAQAGLAQKKQSELKFSRELALLKRMLQQLDKRISAIKKDQQLLQAQINLQQKAIASGQQELRRTGQRLEKRLVSLYKEGDIGFLKILFSADSPTELVQQYHYLTRVLQYDRDLLGEYRQILVNQQQRLTDLKQLQQQKLLLLGKEQEERKVAADGRRLQARLLKKVRAEKKHLKQELASLREKAKRLQSLVTKLHKQPATAPATGSGSFSAGKGKLAWPVNGEVLIGFGTQKDSALGTYYESNGIEINVALGSLIHAVADGRVVFADWFKGYGNLLIMSHQGGFHTLYAQAARLDRTVGEQLVAGNVLGRSGLGGRDTMYFEIRHNGSPVNPLRWLQRR
ncbi:MAG: peptidoglycan DD-metalloendopeptidase family protein [Desulfuromonadales bacterium]|nr:peptidoglycan DD-metalloendopeptidase family protein [Desulfuromonadales bacterium]